MKGAKKTLLMLGAAYFAGVAISSLYQKKDKKVLREELANKDGEKFEQLKVLFANFMDIHSDAMTDVKDKTLTEENIAFLNEKKEDLLKVVDSYKVKWEEYLKTAQDKGVEYKDEALANLNKLYLEKKEELDELIKKSPELVSEYREKLVDYLEDLSKKINDIK